jgi:DNA-binding response OmpR family regulator
MSKILVVDDSPSTVDIAKMLLKRRNYEVVTAEDGEQGLKKAREENPDLIILDIGLPKMEGHEVCRLLKSDEKYKKIPIIIFTVKESLEYKKICKEAGADFYLTKGMDSVRLMGLVDKYLKK